MLRWNTEFILLRQLFAWSAILNFKGLSKTFFQESSPPPQARDMTYSIPRVWRSHDRAFDRRCCYCSRRACLFFTPFWWAHVQNNHGSISVVFCKVNFCVESSALQMYIHLILVWWSDLGLLLVHVDPTYRSYFLCGIRFRSFVVKILIMKKLSDRSKADFWATSTLSAMYPVFTLVHLLWVPIVFLFYLSSFRHAGLH